MVAAFVLSKQSLYILLELLTDFSNSLLTDNRQKLHTYVSRNFVMMTQFIPKPENIILLYINSPSLKHIMPTVPVVGVRKEERTLIGP